MIPAKNVSSILDPAANAKNLLDAVTHKAHLSISRMAILAVLGGFFVTLGGMSAQIVATDVELNGPVKILQGAIFSTALMLIVIVGGELFTSNCMITCAVLEGKVSPLEMLRDWVMVWCFNFLGAITGAALLFSTGITGYTPGEPITTFGQVACDQALHKAAPGFGSTFAQGIFANIFVCSATLMALASRSEIGKIWGIAFPISCFSALGFQHCIANMYTFSIAAMMSCDGFSYGDAFTNLAAATLGNILGGQCLAVTYWYVYLTNDGGNVYSNHHFGKSHRDARRDAVGERKKTDEKVPDTPLPEPAFVTYPLPEPSIVAYPPPSPLPGIVPLSTSPYGPYATYAPGMTTPGPLY